MLYDDATGECSNQEWRDIDGTYYYVDDNFVYFLMCIAADADGDDIPGWPEVPSPGYDEARYKWFIDTAGEDLYVSGTTAYDGEFLLLLEDFTDQGSGAPPSDIGWGATREDQYGELTLIDDLGNEGFFSRWNSATPPEYKQNATIGSAYWRRVLGDPAIQPPMPSNGIQSTPLIGTVPPAGGSTNPDIGYKMGVLPDTPCQSGNGVAMFVSRALIGDPSSICVIPATDQENNNLDQAPNCDRPEDDVTTCISVLLEASLTLEKTVVNDGGGTADEDDFQAYIDGSAVAWDAAETLVAGSYTVSETVVSGYAAGDWGGDCAANGSVTLQPGDEKTCTITNTYIPPERTTLTLVKTVLKDDGGTAEADDFQAHIDGTPVDWNTPIDVEPGSRTVSETVVSGYAAGDWGGDCAADGSVTLEEGDNKTCTITNDDIAPTLTLEKTVVNNDGGMADEDDFQAYIDGSTVDWDAPQTLDAGPYTVSEAGEFGYAAGDWGGDCDANGNVTLEPGDNKTCTITNDDIAPTLTLEKTVVNDDGGTADEDDFQAYIDGNAVDWDAPQTLDAGPYTVSEDVVPGYVADDWGGDCDPRGNVTLGPGESKTCTITNRDLPPVLVGGATVAPREVQMLVLRLAIIGLTGLLGSATGLILWRRRLTQR
jgi:invasion protein IalB